MTTSTTHTADAALQQVTISFSEVMSGYVAQGASVFADAYAEGRARGQRLALHAQIRVGDLQAFLEQRDHAGVLEGRVECDLLGGSCPVVQGQFRLLQDSADRDRKLMIYQAWCTTPSGEPITFFGQKQVQHDAPFDMWSDTTTLYVNVWRGHIDPTAPAQAEVAVCGIIGLDLPEFMRVLRSLRARDADGVTSLRGLSAFGRFFAGKLWDVYGPHLPPAPNQPRRRYPKYTTEGVRDVQVSMHPFSTGDGLGLTLTRFLRRECEDVVLVVHGLTNSTDMFIMPEHRNLVQHLLDEGFTDVWTLDWRGSNRFPYNLVRNRDSFDDVALFDHPAAFAELRRHIGTRRVHVVAHCVGSVTMAMALAAGTVQGVRSLVANSVALTPAVPAWSEVKLRFGPWFSDYLLGIEYFNPSWRRQPGWSVGKGIALAADLVHRECNSPECHMLSFMWGSGRPAVFNHANIAEETHERLGDLFGGTAVHYYRHVFRMVKAGHAAVKFDPGNPRHASLPDNYLEHAQDIAAPMLLLSGQDNRVFADSNIRFHQHMQRVAPGRSQLQVFPGYGHQDVFMGKDAAVDVFPHIVDFLRAHAHA